MKTLAKPSDVERGLMEETIQIALKRVHKGGIPFSALIADDQGKVLAKGVNQVKELSDPTAHAEIMAIREAGKKLGNANLAGATLYASGEPCALCYMAARWAGIIKIYVASDRHQAANAGFDYRCSYHFFNAGEPDTLMQVSKLSDEDYILPFKHWAAFRT